MGKLMNDQKSVSALMQKARDKRNGVTSPVNTVMSPSVAPVVEEPDTPFAPKKKTPSYSPAATGVTSTTLGG